MTLDASWTDRLTDAAFRIDHEHRDIARRTLILPHSFPPIVTLCGSTRFVDVFNETRKRLTGEGVAVLSIEIVTTQSADVDPQHVDPELKARLDELHFRKLDLSDFALILNVRDYIGESTANEIAYAESIGVPCVYFSHAMGEPGDRRNVFRRGYAYDPDAAIRAVLQL